MTSASEDEGIAVLVGVTPMRVISASRGAATLFGTASPAAMARAVFGSAAQMRTLGVRLDRLEPGSPPHLERITIADRFHRYGLTLACEVVSGRPNKTVRMQAAAVPGAARPIAREAPRSGTDLISMVLDEDVAPRSETMSAPSAAPVVEASAREAGPPQRFVWRADRDGRLTHVGGEMAAHLGITALRAGDDLPARLEAVAPAAAAVVRAAMAAGRGWSRIPVAWPRDDVAAVTVLFAGTPAPGHDGYRGFGLMVTERADAAGDQPGAAAQPAAGPAAEPVAVEVPAMAGEGETGLAVAPDTPVVLDGSEPAPDEIEVPAGPDDRDVAAAPVREQAQTDVPSNDGPGRAPGAGGGYAGAQVTPFPMMAGSGTAKVVHLSAFKTGVPVLSGMALSRRESVRTDVPDAPAASLDAPTWAEAPDTAEAKAAADQRLSSHERFNFDEIARALAALPTAESAGLVGKQARPGREPDEAPLVPPPARLSPEPERAVALGPVDGADAWAVLDCLSVGVLVARADAILYANRAMLDLSGFGQLADLQAAGLSHLLQGQEGLRPNPNLGAQGVTLTVRDGTEIEVDARIQRIAWRDEPAILISIRRASDEDARARLAAIGLDLRRSQALASDLAEALDLAASGVGFLDSAGRILSVSRGAERLFGYDQREIVGDAGSILVAAEDQAAWTQFFDGFVSPAGPGRTSAFRKVLGRKRQGGTVPVAVSLRRIDGGRVCVVWQESPHGHATASELETLRRDAERASDRKSEFLAKVSHEIRTPLNAILGFTEIIIEERFGPIGNDRYREYLKDIHVSGNHVVSLLNDLLDLSRIEAGGLDLDLVPVNVNVVLAECVGSLQGQAHRDRIIIRTSLAARTPFALADERAFRQIALNLLSNALKFNEPGGQVIVSTAMTEAGRVVVRVRDTGLGMTPDEIETAMKPFRQLATPKARAGSGLGLPLTKAMVEASQGTLRIESRPREGTLVEVTLPSAPASALSLPAE